MTDLWRTQHQADALARFLDNNNPFGCLGVLRTAWPEFELDLTDGGIQWLAERQLVRRLNLTMTAPRTGASERIDLRVPWLVDDEAFMAAPFEGLGGHTGTFLGRPRMPVTGLAIAPGARLVAAQIKGRIRVHAEVVPNVGHALKIRVKPGSKGQKATLIVTSRGVRGLAAVVVDDVAAGVLAFLSDTGQRNAFDPEMLAGTLLANFRYTRSSTESELEAADITAVVTRLLEVDKALGGWRPGKELPELPAAVDVPMARSRWVTMEYGDHLAEAVYTGTLRAREYIAEVVKSNELRGHEYLLSLVQRETENLACGRGRYSALAVGDRQTNQIARLEVAREQSFLGPRGLEEYSGRMDLRVLPMEWDGEICPVQTPESKKVGLTRFAALGRDAAAGVRAEYAGLSVCASLVPYVNHDDPTRTAIGAKMLKQAVILDAPQAPVVRTGVDAAIAEQTGVVRSPARGDIVAVRSDSVVLRSRGRETAVRFGPALTGWTASQPDRWRVLVSEGDQVTAAQVLAVAPEVEVGEHGDVALRLGIDALVGFLPFHGWNFEDGVVVSESFAKRMTSRHMVSRSLPIASGAQPVVIETIVDPDALADVIPAHTKVAVVSQADEAASLSIDEDARLVTHGQPGRYRYIDITADEVKVTFEVTRPLEVGDKITTRHGGKGVVTKILSDAQMPRVADGAPAPLAGRSLEVLLNPLGTLRRLNLGAILETNAGLAATLSGEGFRFASRALGSEGRSNLADELAGLGVTGGRLPLRAKDGSQIGPDEGVVVGPLHLLKLHHLARSKMTGRFDGGPSSTSFGPATNAGVVDGRRFGRPQRMGEMEIWALEAIGADRVIGDLLNKRGVGDRQLRRRPGKQVASGLRASAAHLAVAGFHLEATLKDGTRRDITVDAAVVPADIVSVDLVWRGSDEDRLGLRNLLEFEDQARALLAPKAKRKDGVAQISSATLAREIVRLSQVETGLLALAKDVLGQEATRYYIPLPVAVPHPWQVGVGEAASSLPNLRSLTVLPALVLGNDPIAEVRRGHPLEATTHVLEKVLALRAGGTRADAPGLLDAVARLIGPLDGPRRADSIASRLQGKSGLLRRNLLGSSAYRSGRGVLVGDPTQDPEEIGLPESLLRDLGISVRDATGISNAEANNVVLLNRQPTLHPYSVVALKARVTNDRAITLHPHVLAAIAGDFDGDTAAAHRVVGSRAAAQLWRLCRPAANLRNSASGKLIAKTDLDVALGQQLLIEAASEADPIEIGLRAGGFDIDGIQHIRRWMDERFAVSTGWSFSAVDLPTVTDVALPYDEETAQQVLQKLFAVDSPAIAAVRVAFAAGAGGKSADLWQMFVRRGEGMLPNEFLPTVDIDENFLDGLANTSYFAAAQTSVGLLAAKKLVTPFAGALTRRLVHLGYESVIGRDDCGSTAEDRSPLSCLDGDLCQACYGTDLRTGQLAPLGTRVGVLAGLLIGEQSTQLAMKSIHQRGKGVSLNDRIEQLEGVFGRRNVTLADGRSTNFARLLNDRHRDGESVADALAPLFEVFSSLLGAVDIRHAQVLLRALANGHAKLLEEPRDESSQDFEIGRAMAVRAAQPRPVLEDLAYTGRLSAAVSALGSARSVGGPEGPTQLTRLLVGAYSDA